MGAVFEETYLSRLERMLDATPGLAGRVEIVKGGQSRYWTEPERLLLELVGVHYQPDLILVGFTPNDVTDTGCGRAPALRAAAATEPMYWTRDIHCTPAGYRVIAETIHAALLERRLVP